MNDLTKEPLVTNTGLNLPADCSEDQFFEVGRTLARIEKGMQWAIGDWYNAITWGDKQAACERAGLSFKAAAKYGRVARDFQITSREAICSFKHHERLAVDNLSNDQRVDLLKQAEEHKWSSARLTKERDAVLGKKPKPKPEPAPEPEDETMSGNKSAAMLRAEEDGITRDPVSGGRNATTRKVYAEVLETEALMAGAPEDWEKKYQAYRKRTLASIEDRAAAIANRMLRDMAQDLLDELESLREHNRSIRRGYKSLYDESEFKLVLGCLHPDSSPGTDRKTRAFDLLNKNKDVLMIPPLKEGAVRIPRTVDDLLKRRKVKA